MTSILQIPDNLQDRIIRLFIFIITNFIILRYLSGIDLTDYEQIKIVIISTICLMFINTYYPYVAIK
jgi:hypothetical protein